MTYMKNNFKDENKILGSPPPISALKKIKANKLEDKTIWKLVEDASNVMVQSDYKSFDLELVMLKYREILMKLLQSKYGLPTLAKSYIE